MQPIVIVGCQRSGTTFLGAIIGSHSRTVALPEAQFFIDCMPNAPHEIREDIASIEQKIRKHYRFKIWNYSMPRFAKSSGSFCELYEHLVGHYSKDKFDKIPSFWIEHQPGHIKHLAKIRRAYPNTKVINIIRDGRAVANSILGLDWGPNSINRAAYFWEKRVGYGLAAQHYLGTSCKTIRYEDLVSSPKETLISLCEFLGLEFEDSMLNGKGLNVPKFTINQHDLVGKEADTSRINSWKNDLSKRNIEVFETLTGDFLEYLGYEKLNANARGVSAFEAFKYDFTHLYLTLLNKIRFRQRVSRSIVNK